MYLVVLARLGQVGSFFMAGFWDAKTRLRLKTEWRFCLWPPTCCRVFGYIEAMCLDSKKWPWPTSEVCVNVKLVVIGCLQVFYDRGVVPFLLVWRLASGNVKPCYLAVGSSSYELCAVLEAAPNAIPEKWGRYGVSCVHDDRKLMMHEVCCVI